MPYFENDILSLAYIINQLNRAFYSATGGLYCLNNTLTTANLTFKNFKQHCIKEKIELFSYDNETIYNYMQKFVNGGRVINLIHKYNTIPDQEIQPLINKLVHYEEEIKEEFYNLEDKTTSIDKYYDKHYNVTRKYKELYGNINNLIPVDYNSLYPSTMSCNKFKWPKFKDVHEIEIDKLDQLKNDITNMKYYNKSVILCNCDIFIPEDNYFQCVGLNKSDKQYVKELDKTAIKRLYANGYFYNQHLSNILLEDLIKYNNAEIIKIHHALIFTQYYDKSPFESYITELYNKRLENKKLNPVLANTYKLMMNSLYGKMCQKLIKNKYYVCNELSHIDTDTINVQKLNNGQYILNKKKIEDEKFFYPSYLGICILDYSKRLMNEIIAKITPNALKNPIIYYTDTDSIYIPLWAYNQLKKDGLIGDNLFQMKNDYQDNSQIIYFNTLMPKCKFTISVNKDGILKSHVTYKGVPNMTYETFNELSKLLLANDKDRAIIVNKNIWSRSIANGVIINDIKCELRNTPSRKLENNIFYGYNLPKINSN